jgi:hypothetical protein
VRDRHRRRCAACGVALPVDAARCPTCGHAEGDPLHPSNEGARGRRPVVVGVLVVLALVGALAVIDRWSSSDGERTAAGSRDDATTTTADRPTRTSALMNTPTTPPARTFQPTIPLPAGQRLLGWVAPGWGEVLDPATGTITSTRLASGSEFISVVPRLGGAVVLNGGSASAQWFPELPTSDEPNLVQTGAAELYPSDIETRVWILRNFSTVVFAEFDVTTGEVSDEVRLPAAAWPRGSIDGGIVVQAPGGLFAYRRGESRFEPIAAGEYVASLGSLVAHRRCNELMACPIFVRDLAGGTEVEMAGDGLAGVYIADGEFSPDGRWLAVLGQDPSGWQMTVFETATGRSRPASAGPARTAGFAQVTWTPDSAWLLWPESPGIRGFHPADNTAAFIDAGGGAYQGVVVLGGPVPGAG